MFHGLFYINIPRLSHDGMENARTTVKLRSELGMKEITGILENIACGAILDTVVYCD